MAYFTRLVGAALRAPLLASPASARQWWVMEGAEPIDPVYAAPAGPLPKRYVIDNGLNTSPAFLYERMKGLGDTTAHIEEERGGEIHVYYMDPKRFRGVYVRFFRTREACQALCKPPGTRGLKRPGN